ncbi:MAG: TrkA family potassium uptake protein [Scrofimicrobium sp.]
MADRDRNRGTLVVGMGRFGAAVALTLERLGFEVLAMEKNRNTVQHYTGVLPLVEGDATDPEALEQVGAADFSSAVVGVGTSLESSVLITANLVDAGVKSIWAKATSREHGRILRRIGAHHVVYPEYDAGMRTAHLVGGELLDYIEMDQEEFVVAKMRPPKVLNGFALAESQVESKYSIKVIGTLRPGKPFRYADATTSIDEGDILIVSGTARAVIQFSELPR